MPIKGIILLAVLAIVIAICFRDEIYNYIISLSKDKPAKKKKKKSNLKRN